MKTFKTKPYKKNTFTLKNKNNKNNKKTSLQKFENEITVYFFEMLLMIKLFHWKTYSHSIHKATDELYSNINTNMDKFIEVLLGKSGVRIDLTHKKQIQLMDVKNTEELIIQIEKFKNYLMYLSENKAMQLMKNMDLYNIRDELMANLNQFLFLLTLK